ncbi:MAG: LptF/LptG family permease [Spirochaetaceae bacterium]|jgi:lipopolysaccharide export system permease protein|nr:LptF/LptG family permease [Spirochaetaceae bacterium]
MKALPVFTGSKTIFFYIIREIFFAFFVCFLFFFFVFFVNQLLLMAREILSKRVPLFEVALLVLYALPSIIAMASPFACLTGTLMTIGRLNSNNEILVFLSSGLSYRSVFLPALLVGVLISLFSFFANDILLPAGTVQFSRLYRRILISSPALELEANSVKRFKNSVIITGQVTGRAIQDILIIDRTRDGERRIISAREASLEDLGEGGLSINLVQAFVQSGRENLKKNYDYALAKTLSYRVSQDDMMEGVYDINAREMSSVDVKKEIIKQEKTILDNVDRERRRIAEDALVIENALRRGSREHNRFDSLMTDWSYTVDAAAQIPKDRNFSTYRLEYYKKFSIPFGGISFVLAAVSIGLMTRKSGQVVGFIVGICIAALYWGLLLIGQALGTILNFSPFWSMWFPNVLAISLGLGLTLAKASAK